jgi:hypothetical protein
MLPMVSQSVTYALRAGLFRALPLLLKPSIYENDKGYFTEKFRGKEIPGVHARDVTFVNQFFADAEIKDITDGAFKVLTFSAYRGPV